MTKARNGCLNRTLEKAEDLAAAVGSAAEAVPWEAVESRDVQGDVLVNCTAVGMSPDDKSTPLGRSALKGYRLVFDAVYTPLETRLLKVRWPTLHMFATKILWKFSFFGLKF
jgi:3-dehydroquinate dehydratase / shikimate dehydrogenase